MSTFTFNIYLVEDIDGDGNPDYVLQDEGRVILETKSISVDSSYRYIGGQIGRRATPALTFDIRKGPNDEWYLFYNKGVFAGKYPTQAAAVGILYGIYTSFDGLDDGFVQWIADSLEKGSYIEPDENVLVLTEENNNLTVDLSLYSTSSTSAYALALLGWQDVDSFGNPVTITNITNLTNVTALDGGSQTALFTGSWNSVNEGDGARPVLVGTNSPTGPFVVVAAGAALTKPAPDPVIDFEVEVSGTNGLPATDVDLGGFAYAVITDSSTNGTPSFTYEWYQSVPTLTGITLTNEGA